MSFSQNTFFRGRRLRQSAQLRAMMKEVYLTKQNLIMPYFIADSEDVDYKKPIASMPGQYQFSLASFEKHIEKVIDKGLCSLILFGIPKSKDAIASEGFSEDGVIQKAVRMLKKRWPHLIVITDVCLCEYTDHGHCGILKTSPLNNETYVDNDETLEILAKIALSHAKAGVDIVAPSDMMDGRVLAIRQALDNAKLGFENIPIMSYSVKYASAFYGPFRDAAESAPQSGDRKSYQMDYAVQSEALREAEADIAEGADMLIVKPAGAYQDVIKTLKDNFDVPLVAYQVSGEYSMIKAAALNGWINEDAIVYESLIGMRRAGAQLIFSYFTEDLIMRGIV